MCGFIIFKSHNLYAEITLPPVCFTPIKYLLHRIDTIRMETFPTQKYDHHFERTPLSFFFLIYVLLGGTVHRNDWLYGQQNLVK